MKIKKKIELSPFADLDFKICNPDISKNLTARGFKLGQLIEDDEKLIRENFKKSYFILFELGSLCTF